MNQNETKKRLPLHCPACEAPLKVAKMVCDQCGTEVSGVFDLPVVEELLNVIEKFIKP